jgi:hypothetical protein
MTNTTKGPFGFNMKDAGEYGNLKFEKRVAWLP